jgi:hypothetical protein
MSWKLRGQVPGQEFLDTVDWVIGDALQDMAKIEFGVEIVELGRAASCKWPPRLRRRHRIRQIDNSCVPERPRAVPARLPSCLFRLRHRRGNGQPHASERARSGWPPQCQTCARVPRASMEPALQVVHQRPRSCLADLTPQVCRPATNLAFDIVKLPDALNSFVSDN